MEEIIKKLSEPLTKDDVECRIGSTTEKGFSLLLYKTARTDVRRLNDVCGMDWGNKHSIDQNGNVTCEISVYDADTKQWVSRHDTGTESNTEKEKGSYSDSFKRAGFRFGIGLELYESPFIWINWEMTKNQKGKLVPKGLYGGDMVISNYKAVKGCPQVEITIKGKVVFTNISEASKPPSKPDVTPHNADDCPEVYESIISKIKACTTQEQLDKITAKEKKMENYFRKNNRLDLNELILQEIETKQKELK